MLEDTIQATTKGFVEWHMLRDGFDYILNNNGKDHYFPREEGEYYAIVYNTFGCTQASANVIKIGTVPETSSIEARDEISVFPNPVADVLSVTAPAGSIISVIDITGGTIFDQTAVSEVSEINVHSWSAGMYLVRIRDKGNARLIKVVKQ